MEDSVKCVLRDCDGDQPKANQDTGDNTHDEIQGWEIPARFPVCRDKGGGHHPIGDGHDRIEAAVEPGKGGPDLGCPDGRLYPSPQ